MFPFQTALNASTLFPFKLNVLEQVREAAEAGYDGIELWVRDIEDYLANGGTIAALSECLEKSGITLVGAIAFFKWADKSAEAREQGFVQAEREMKLLAELGCRAIAAPPYGDVEQVTLAEMAAYFAELASLARGIGIEPYLEFWGRAKQLFRIDDAVFVAQKSGVNEAKLLLDPFHMYTGGSDFETLKQLKGSQIGIFHVNDYPSNPGRETITDADRVFPGEGIAPSRELARILHEIGYQGYLSLELFIDNYDGLTALEVAQKGLYAMKNAYQIEG
ncbi:sugar phosphate isomerase/epimerase family protein [Paenibacillus abyssi]|uniref:sugar phosphate isomerase/epimerase family protein n=1 Tax=Paenibacillus abyssi TaxID=1340531 RepID=UPI001E31C959|nr:sugar phosphate isomerase/epimerase family protein [Paenibacillus abyssi]